MPWHPAMVLHPVPLVFLAIFSVFAIASGASGAQSEADPDNPAEVALGEKIYAEHCASCHGKNLEGEPNWRQRKPDGRNPAPPHDYHGHTWRHAEDELFGMVKQGFAAYAPPGYPTDMMGFANVLSDDEIWAVLAFIKSKWPPEFREYQAKITAGAKPR